MSVDNPEDATAEDVVANDSFDTGLRLGIASALGQTGFNSQTDDGVYRNYYDVFDWPKDDLDGWDDENWLALYLRNGYAQTVNDKLSEVSWRDSPNVSDAPESEEDTAFEQAIEKADKNLNLWSYCSRVDKVAGIGQHGLLVLGLSDVSGNSTDVWETDATEKEFTDLDDIQKLKPVLETQIEDIDWGGPEDGERWGKPIEYTIDFSDDIDDETEDDVGYRDIHWSRVINVPAQAPLDDETLSRPRAEPVLNNLLDIEKTLGSVAEAAFMSANTDLWLNSDPEKVDLSQDASEVRDELMRNAEGQPFIRTQGMELEQLDGDVQDPSGIIEKNLEVISSVTGIPKSKLRGNQAGEVSGSEADERSLFGAVEERREQYNNPWIVRNVVDRLVSLEIVPQPEGGMYSIEWPDLAQLSEKDQAEIEVNRAQVLRQAGPTVPGLSGSGAQEYLKTGDIPEDVEVASQPAETPEMQAQFDEQFGVESNVDGIDLTPPEAAQNHAQDVLDWREDDDKTVSGMIDTGWERARQLASGEELSPDDVKEIHAWFARHGPEEYELNDSDMDPWEDNGRVSIKGWGGPTMRDWVGPKRRRLAEMGELKPVANATRYEEGDEVDTPDGVGVVVEIREEDFEGPDGAVEASENSPAYVVGTMDGAAVYRASDLSKTTIETDVENPESDLADMSANSKLEALQNLITGNQETTFGMPDSWQESETPNRLILLKAWAGLGGRFTSCVREMRGDITGSPDRFCASMKDRVLQWEGWRR